jgi:hypothetical protein
MHAHRQLLHLEPLQPHRSAADRLVLMSPLSSITPGPRISQLSSTSILQGALLTRASPLYTHLLVRVRTPPVHARRVAAFRSSHSRRTLRRPQRRRPSGGLRAAPSAAAVGVRRMRARPVPSPFRSDGDEKKEVNSSAAFRSPPATNAPMISQYCVCIELTYSLRTCRVRGRGGRRRHAHTPLSERRRVAADELGTTAGCRC